MQFSAVATTAHRGILRFILPPLRLTGLRHFFGWLLNRRKKKLFSSKKSRQRVTKASCGKVCPSEEELIATNGSDTCVPRP